MRAEAAEIQGDWRKIAAEYRDTIPEQVKNAREWTDRFGPTTDKIDSVLTRADVQLGKGVTLTAFVVAVSEPDRNEPLPGSPAVTTHASEPLVIVTVVPEMVQPPETV